MSQSCSSTALRISLPDIARLTHVQRPVVSMWRSRSAKSDQPFPTSIATEQGQEYFDLDEIVGWVDATGRGNNKTVREDAAAFATLDGGSPRGDEVVFLGLTALLCLSATSGRSLGRLTTADLLDLADETDPDDQFLYREVDALGGRLAPLGRYADLLADAAYSPLAAFEQLMSERFRLHVPGHTTVGLTPIGRQLIAELAIALAAAAGDDTPTYVDPTVGGSDLLIEVAHRVDESAPMAAQTSAGNDPAARLARRRLLIHDIPTVQMIPDEFGGFEMPPAAVLLAQYPSPGRPNMTDSEILDAIDSSVLEMLADGYGVVIGPAGALTDNTAAAEQRTAILRTNRVRAIVRLPVGLVTTRPRLRMALWVLGPSSTGLRVTGSDPLEPRTMVADLANVTLDDASIDSLITDLVAGLGAPNQHRHEAHFTRYVFNRALVSVRGGLLTTSLGRTSVAESVGAEIMLRAKELGQQLQAALMLPSNLELSVPEVRPTTFRSTTTLGAAISVNRVRILPGHRVSALHLGTARTGSTAVLGIEEVTGESRFGTRTINRLVFAANYPAGRYTEPGDVIFCTTPQPAAIIDVDGGSVVVFPARIARVATAGSLSPHVLAADINTASAHAKSYRAWVIRQIPDDQQADLDRALTDLRSQRAALSARIGAVDELATLLIRGASSGALRIDTPMKGQ